MKKQRLLEALADIAFIAGERNYFTGDSRADVSNFIIWAEEFEIRNAKANWSEVDYILEIEKFTAGKLNGNIPIATINDDR